MNTWKKELHLYIFILSFCACDVFAMVNFYSDGTIDSGTPVASVSTWNNAKVSMAGATITSLDTFNSSQVTMLDGMVTQGTSVWGGSQLTVKGGSVDLSLEVHDLAVVNLRGGSVNGWVYAEDESVINLYAYGVNYNPDEGRWNGGQISGYWYQDNANCSLDLVNNLDSPLTTYNHINIVPEPAALSLLALGTILARRKK